MRSNASFYGTFLISIKLNWEFVYIEYNSLYLNRPMTYELFQKLEYAVRVLRLATKIIKKKKTEIVWVNIIS